MDTPPQEPEARDAAGGEPHSKRSLFRALWTFVRERVLEKYIRRAN